MDLVRDKLILNKLKALANKYELLVFVLFGSRAKGDYSKHSDFDFAFYTKELRDGKFKEDLRSDLEVIFGRDKIDLINLNSNDDILLRKEIFFNGFCIFEKYVGLFDELNNSAYFNYLDFEPLYKIEEEIVNERLERLGV